MKNKKLVRNLMLFLRTALGASLVAATILLHNYLFPLKLSFPLEPSKPFGPLKFVALLGIMILYTIAILFTISPFVKESDFYQDTKRVNHARNRRHQRFEPSESEKNSRTQYVFIPFLFPKE